MSGLTEDGLRRIIRQEIRASRQPYGPFHAYMEGLGAGSPVTAEPLDRRNDPADRSPQRERLSTEELVHGLRIDLFTSQDPLPDRLGELTDALRDLRDVLVERHVDSSSVEGGAGLLPGDAPADTVEAPSDGGGSSAPPSEA